MPIKFLKIMGLFIFSFVAVHGSVNFFSTTTVQSRKVASLPISKMGKEQTAQYFFDIKTIAEYIAQNDHEISVITIQLQSVRSIKSGLQYHWNLPEGVEVVEGLLVDSVNEFSPEQTQDFTLKVKGFSKENLKYIRFEIIGDTELGPVKRVVLISTRPENSLEYQIQNNFLNSSSNSENNKLNILKNKFNPDNVVK